MYYVLEHTSQNQKKKTFFLASRAPRNWATALEDDPTDPKYAQEPCEDSELPSASKLGHSFCGKPVFFFDKGKFLDCFEISQIQKYITFFWRLVFPSFLVVFISIDRTISYEHDLIQTQIYLDLLTKLQTS